MAQLEWRDRVSLGAGALMIVGALLLVIAFLATVTPLGLAGAATAASGTAVLTRQRRANRRH